jgi:hypothetical protein
MAACTTPDALLFLVPVRIIGQPRERGGQAGRHPEPDQPARARTAVARGVQHSGAQERTDRELGEGRMQRVTEPYAVQHVLHPARPQGLVGGVAHRAREPVERWRRRDAVDHTELLPHVHRLARQR